MAKNGPGENGGGELIYKGKWGGGTPWKTDRLGDLKANKV